MIKNLRTVLVHCCGLTAVLAVFCKAAGIYPAGALFELAAGVSMGGVSWFILGFSFRVLSAKGLTPFSLLISASALLDIVILHSALVTRFSFAAACVVMVLLFVPDLIGE